MPVCAPLQPASLPPTSLRSGPLVTTCMTVGASLHIGHPQGKEPQVHTALSTESSPTYIRLTTCPQPPRPGQRRRAERHPPGLAHAGRGSTAHLAPTNPAPSSVPAEGTDGRQPQKPQSPCSSLGTHPARRHVQPAHTAGLHSRGPTEALVLAAPAPRGGPAVGNWSRRVGRPTRSRRGRGRRQSR